MGLFGKLLGNVVGEAMSETLDKALDKAAGTITSTVKNKLEDILPPEFLAPGDDGKKEEHGAGVTQESAQKVQDKTPKGEWTVAGLHKNIQKALGRMTSLSNGRKEVRTDISPADIGGIQPYKNYDFGIYEEGRPVAFIVVTQHNRENKHFRGAKAAARNAKVDFVSFYTQFPNTDEYIENRLRGYIES